MEDPTSQEPHTTSSPPPAPPLPRISGDNENLQVKIKLKTAPMGRFDVFNTANPEPSGSPPPIGLYFFYGTLMDPGMLTDILGLEEMPVLCPALLHGYTCKLWGQYPALVEQAAHSQEIGGAVYQVQTEEDAQKLGNYETSNYRPQLCSIRYTDGKEPAAGECYAFIFAGNPRSLSGGEFDLSTWLKRIRRQVDNL